MKEANAFSSIKGRLEFILNEKNQNISDLSKEIAIADAMRRSEETKASVSENECAKIRQELAMTKLELKNLTARLPSEEEKEIIRSYKAAL